MKAVLITGPRKAEVVEVERPSAMRGELIIRMVACGLCGTDVEKIEGGYTASKPVIGHEAAGIVEEVGEGVGGISKGDRVVPHHHVPCYSCYFCLNGSPTMCPSYREYNFEPGGFAEYFRVPAWNVSRGGVFKVPNGVSLEEASLTEPTACCIRSIRRVGFREGESAMVVGVGPMGLTHVQLLIKSGAELVVAVDVNEMRLEAASKFGALAMSSKEDVHAEVARVTGGRGVDIAIVSSGSPAALATALKSVRRGGRVCLFGVPPIGSKLDYDLSGLITREVSIISSNAATEAEMREALTLISEGVLDLRPMITHNYSLDEFERALEVFKSGNSLKVLIKP